MTGIPPVDVGSFVVGALVGALACLILVIALPYDGDDDSQ